MARLTPLSFFAYYHLGYDETGNYKFRNLHDASSYFGIPNHELEAFMEAHQMHPDIFPRIDFNLAAIHADGQVLSVIGASMEEIQEFARKSFEGFTEALTTFDPNHVFEDIDWDDPFGFGEAEGEPDA